MNGSRNLLGSACAWPLDRPIRSEQVGNWARTLGFQAEFGYSERWGDWLIDAYAGHGSSHQS